MNLRSLQSTLLGAALVLSVLAAPWAATPARADIALQWQNTEIDEREQLLADFLTESNVMTDLLALLQQNFVFEPSLKFIIGAADGPQFDLKTNTIHFPYAYISDVLEGQIELLEEGETAIERSLDVVEYTLYHLVAHALIGSTDTDSDNEAERIASWLMVRGFDNGAEQLVVNARAFGAASQKLDGPLEEYWHSHALFASRQKDIECWALGLDPDNVEHLLRAVIKPNERLDDCASAWVELDHSVQTLLAEKLKDDAPIVNQ